MEPPPRRVTWRTTSWLEKRGGDVDAISVCAPVEPEPHDFLELCRDLWIPPVEVGLLGREEVQVPLAARLVAGPSRAAECGPPVVGGRSVRLAVGKVIE